MVLVVPPVQVHVVGVKQKVGKQQHHHFNGVFPTIYKVPVEHVRRLRRRKAILNGPAGNVYYLPDVKLSDNKFAEKPLPYRI